MIAIETKYLGPTNFRGSRIKAYTVNGQSLTVSYDNALNSDEMHRSAAEALRDENGWTGELIAGSTKTGYVFVFVPERAK